LKQAKLSSFRSRTLKETLASESKESNRLKGSSAIHDPAVLLKKIDLLQLNIRY
jgi:hypothetical protein